MNKIIRLFLIPIALFLIGKVFLGSLHDDFSNNCNVQSDGINFSTLILKYCYPIIIVSILIGIYLNIKTKFKSLLPIISLLLLICITMILVFIDSTTSKLEYGALIPVLFWYVFMDFKSDSIPS